MTIERWGWYSIAQAWRSLKQLRGELSKKTGVSKEQVSTHLWAITDLTPIPSCAIIPPRQVRMPDDNRIRFSEPQRLTVGRKGHIYGLWSQCRR